MRSIIHTAKRFIECEAGPTATEYAVMLALIVLVALGAIVGIGTKVDTTFETIGTGLPTGTGS